MFKNPHIVRKGEEIGGGWLVFRRGKKTNRISARSLPFEHPSKESAKLEVERLSKLFPNERFEIFGVCKDEL